MRVEKEGKKNLVCILKGHICCPTKCKQVGCDRNDRGHCLDCGAILVTRRLDPQDVLKEVKTR